MSQGEVVSGMESKDFVFSKKVLKEGFEAFQIAVELEKRAEECHRQIESKWFSAKSAKS